jgi:LPXTG-motif cell wall-anchored protein
VGASTASGACAPAAIVAAKAPSAVPAAGVTAAKAGTAAAAAAGGQLARTGTDARDLATAAGLSMAMGGVFLALGRRRKAVPADA